MYCPPVPSDNGSVAVGGYRDRPALIGMPPPIAPLPTSLGPCCVHVPLLRVNTHAAPEGEKSFPLVGAASTAVLPSADSATDMPLEFGLPNRTTAHQLGSLLCPCAGATGEHPDRPYVGAAVGAPPTMAVLPSSDSATDKPLYGGPRPHRYRPTSGPCCAREPPRLRVNTHGCAYRRLLSCDPANNRGVAVGRQRDGTALARRAQSPQCRPA